MKKYAAKIKDLINQGRLILFIGSGLSVPLGLPSWGSLIDFMGEQLGYDPKVFDLYGDYLPRAEYYKIYKKGDLSELRQWMDNNWRVSDEKIKKSETHELLASLNVKTIYTTNYDHCLEQAFSLKKKAVKRVVSIEDMYDTKEDNVQVIKFHGDMDKPESMVLTESDYFDRMEFENPLDILLRSDMLTHSFLFLGYSMSDPNLRMLVYKLNRMWRGLETTNRPDSFIFMAKPNEIQKTIFENRGITPVIGSSPKATLSTVEFLKMLL